ncbi:MAG TPA: ATP synthase F1 subunit delta [Phycisphaerae bacterium]|nr:ATP synthase F1 subunit delta [Phycisphaerae bacterium]HNU45044.1 ATP synthase F1 subunit delta [Phycisphaerae bacterium]
MGSTSDTETGLAQVYSGSLLALAQERNQAESVAEELHGLTSLLAANPQWGAFLVSPTVDTLARAAAIERVFRGRVSDLVVNALQVLNRKGRLAILERLVEAYDLALEQLRGRVLAQVHSAVPLSDALRRRLQEVVTRYAGCEADLVETVVPELLGGLVVRVGDQKIDMSLATQLRRLAERLTVRASLEIHSKRAYVEGGAVR